jgi:hypothetical protein
MQCFNDETWLRAVQAIDKDVKKEVDDAVAAAKASPEIGLERMYEDIYIHPIQHVCVVTQYKYTRPAVLRDNHLSSRLVIAASARSHWILGRTRNGCLYHSPTHWPSRENACSVDHIAQGLFYVCCASQVRGQDPLTTYTPSNFTAPY